MGKNKILNSKESISQIIEYVGEKKIYKVQHTV